MSEIARYESLLAAWQQKAEIARQMRAFMETGGEHRLRVAVVNADPVLGAVAGQNLNALMDGTGWRKIVQIAVSNAEAAATEARNDLVRMALTTARVGGIQ